MNKIIVILTLSFIAMISGCDEETKTTQWYRDHPDELKAVYEKCQKNGSASENCKNANEAHYQIQQLNAPALKFHE
ncbi:TPA: EexN family lipoprotein [Klebsiella michiganensis]|uniref:EexN family lipoprotein n=1 Tax=unclassified Klebsiella TaxID=2608929 RepID=UPI00027C3E72|nr:MULTISPECIES: EexN family lipoprotein [unclassified Klebsiella]EJU29000.1 putative lipoprotein [Klebsiella sp. OBRC7]MDU7818827.1 EexN family lipoprotein [Klebsiella sp.]HDH0674133.1 EexN family lipoprotein [Klebsiella michiganensis]HDS5558038.1 EexN family lipoprotein [Klebsiella michiganensis]